MELTQGFEEGGGGSGRGDPFGGGVVDVVEDDVDADGGARPAKAVEEVDRHGGIIVLGELPKIARGNFGFQIL